LDIQKYLEDGGLPENVTIVSHVNGDDEIAKFASICYGKEDAQNKESLIKLLLANGHTSVFEFANFTFRIKCPIFVARQWMRHRMGSYVEKSLRYTKAENFYIPEGTDAKQLFDAAIRTSISAYETLLAIGVKKEQARAVLPLSVMTEFYWNVNARSLMNFLKLRLDKHAQLEIREYAQEIMNIFESKMPITAKYFKEMI